MTDKELACVELAVQELSRATKLHPPLNSAHEAFAVVLEECDELRHAVWLKQSDPARTDAMREEATHLAAMALRFLHDITPPGDDEA